MLITRFVGSALGFGDLRPFLIAAALGIGIGFERDWSNRNSEQQAAGTRTFAVLSLAGSLAASLSMAVVAVGAGGVILLLTAGYVRTAKEDRGTTTEVAAFATFLLGCIAYDNPSLAVGIAVVLASILASKAPLHRFSREIVSAAELEDALRFFVIAFVVLPLLPNRDLGPYNVLNPSRIWSLVVVLTAISWAGYIATRLFGTKRGLLVAGFAGGFVSATATTAAMGRQARSAPDTHRSALASAVIATAATMVQLGAILTFANGDMATKAFPALCAGFAVLAIEAFVLARSQQSSEERVDVRTSTPDQPAPRPFAFRSALMLVGILTAVLLLSRWASDVAGHGGTYWVAALAGLADAHAAALSSSTLANAGAIGTNVAVLASAAGLATNTITKCVVGVIAGGPKWGLELALLFVVPGLITTAVLLMTV